MGIIIYSYCKTKIYKYNLNLINHYNFKFDTEKFLDIHQVKFTGKNI